MQPALFTPSAHPPLSEPASAPHWGTATDRTLGLRTTAAHDADEHADNLTGWEQRYDQLSAGAFAGELREWCLPHMQVFREHTSQALRQACRVWEDSFWFGVPVGGWGAAGAAAVRGETPSTRINGRRHGAHDIMVRPGGEAFELVTPATLGLFGIVVQRATLVDAAARQGCEVDWTSVQTAEVLQVQPRALLRCQLGLAGLLQHTGDAQDGPAAAVPNAAQLDTLEEALMSNLLDLLDHSVVDPELRHSHARRRRVVDEARALALAQPDHAVTVPELCERLHVSRRTLQYCFEDELGLSPMAYLRAVRLNGVRRQLRDVARQRATGGMNGVQDVAAHWGFWHMSQFAADYRKLFAEAPSQTLRRAMQ
jgi:AraC family ethanolamine operon transcriptional activator